MKKGYLYTIEVMIAIAIILISVTYLFRYPLNVTNMDDETIRAYGINSINSLMDQDLRQLAYRNITGLNERLAKILPATISANACIVCNPDLPKDRSVVSIYYYLSGDQRYSAKTLTIYLWRKAI